MGKPHRMRNRPDAISVCDINGYRARTQVSPAVIPAVLGRVVRIELELVNHRSLRVGYGVGPANGLIETNGDSG